MSREEAAGRVGGLFERHGRTVYGICRAMLRDVHEAEDATQQVFLSAHRAIIGGATVRDAGGWLATIARNECRARIAAGMRRPLLVADEDLDALSTGVDEQARRSQLEEIRGALAGLPERQREAVVLRYLYGLQYREVATALGLSRPATEALLFRARRALRVSLRPVAAILVVPAVVREELALALPGFEAKGASVTAGAGAAAGLLAKLTAGSAGAKVATTAAAVATVGAVGSVNSDRPVPRLQETVSIEQPASKSDSTPRNDDDVRVEPSGVSDERDEVDDPSGRGGPAGDDAHEDAGHDRDERTSSGTGSGKRADDDPNASGPSSETHDDPTDVDVGSGSSGPGPDDGGDRSGSANSDSGSSGSGSSGSGSSGASGSGSGSDDETTTTESDAKDDELDD